jgi:DNA anti-recombination protein RmuC
MGDLLCSISRPVLIYLALGLLSISGWGSFAYVNWSARQQVEALTSKRERLIVELTKSRAAQDQLQRSHEQLERSHEQLRRSAGDLRQVEAKLNAARNEHRRVLEIIDSGKAQLAAAREGMAGLLKRIEQRPERERADQTGSIRPEPLKPLRR